MDFLVQSVCTVYRGLALNESKYYIGCCELVSPCLNFRFVGLVQVNLADFNVYGDFRYLVVMLSDRLSSCPVTVSTTLYSDRHAIYYTGIPHLP